MAKVYYCSCGAGPFRLSRANAGAKGVCCYKCAFGEPKEKRNG
jgi:hypothetical protein